MITPTIMVALAGLLLVPVIILQVCRLIATWVARAPPEDSVRRLLQALAEDLHTERCAHEAVERTLVHLPMPWCWRARRLLRTWQNGEGGRLVDDLAHHRLIPRALVAGGRQAEAAGPVALRAWLETAATAPSWSTVLALRLMTTLAEAVGCTAVLWFIGTVILPKFLQIFAEIGVPVPWWFHVLSHRIPLPLVGLGVVAAVIAGFLVVGWRTWSAIAREAAGRAILAGVAQGLPEADLPGGKPGDFAAAAEAAGFPMARDPSALAEALGRRHQQRQRRRLVVATLLDLTVPLLLAVPVTLTAVAIVGSLVAVLHHLEKLP